VLWATLSEWQAAEPGVDPQRGATLGMVKKQSSSEGAAATQNAS